MTDKAILRNHMMEITNPDSTAKGGCRPPRKED